MVPSKPEKAEFLPFAKEGCLKSPSLLFFCYVLFSLIVHSWPLSRLAVLLVPCGRFSPAQPAAVSKRVLT